MVKGTPSMGKKHYVTHIRCRRCGRASYKKNKNYCAACGYGKSAKMRTFSWQTRTLQRARRF